MKETARVFGKDGSLVGVLTEPDTRGERVPTFVFLNSGLIHRVGPNRLYVQAARALATRGVPSVRFDLSGVGDSPSRNDGRDLDQRRVAETLETLEDLSRGGGDSRFVLCGNCSGATVAFLAAREDPRVGGVVLINPQGPRLARFYLRLAGNRKSWRRLLGGRARYGTAARISGLGGGRASPKSPAIDPAAELRVLADRNVEILMILSEWDPALDYYRAVLAKKLAGTERSGRLKVELLAGMNHELDLLWAQSRVVELVREWAEHRFRSAPRPAEPALA